MSKLSLFLRDINIAVSADAVTVHNTGVYVDAPELDEALRDKYFSIFKMEQSAATGIPEVPAIPEPEPEPEPQYELRATAKAGAYPLEKFIEKGWSEEALIREGYAEKVLVEPVKEVIPEPAKEPEVPDVPSISSINEVLPDVNLPEPVKLADNQFQHKGKTYQMTALAKANTLVQFERAGWTKDLLIERGYAECIEIEIPKPVKWPRKEGTVWVDSKGDLFDSTKHQMGSDGVPPVTAKGIFKKTRKAKSPSAPAEPIPTVSAEPEIPSIPAVKSEPKQPEVEIPPMPSGDMLAEADLIPDPVKGSSEDQLSLDIPEAPGSIDIPEATSADDVGDELAALIKDWS